MQFSFQRVSVVAKKESVLKRVFGFMWRAIALVYGLMMLIMLLAVPLTFYFVFSGSGSVTVKDNVALVWEPRGALIEQRDVAPTNLLATLLGRSDPESVVADLVKALERAANDDRIKMVFLKLDELGSASPGQLAELAHAIDRFKVESDKKVVAWSPGYSQAQYRLAAHADTVYLDPLGYVFLEGFSVYHKYFAEALDKLGITMHVFRVGQYKSAVEPFIRNSMSPAARAANRAWLQTLWRNWKQGVAVANEWKPAHIKDYIHGFGKTLQSMNGNTAKLAKQAGLADKLATLAQVRDAMRAIVGQAESHGSFRQIHYLDYLRATQDRATPDQAEAMIAKVVVEGPIVVGKSMRGAAGGATVASKIRRVRRNPHAAAMVLRINSPGGSVHASERIRRQVALMRDAGKPVVVSMAGVAASGGYWIAMNANRIYAQKSTITGSIGVFALMPTYAKPLSELGIHTDGLGTTPLSGILRGDRPLQPEAKRILQSGVRHIYDTFVRKVAKARDMSVESVGKVAQGRVWSGADALRIGLVDKIGGLNAAIKAAAKFAGLQPGDYRVETIRSQTSWRSMLSQLLRSRASLSVVPDWLQNLITAPAFNWLQYGLDDPRGLYSYCFCRVTPTDAQP